MSGPKFDSIKHLNPYNVEYWEARELQPLLGYQSSWQNFEKVIEKAKVSCEATSNIVTDHFNDTIKPITGGKGAVQRVKDYYLSRLADRQSDCIDRLYRIQLVLPPPSPLPKSKPPCYTVCRNTFCHTHACNRAPEEVLDVNGNVPTGDGGKWRAKEVRELWTLALVIVGPCLLRACFRDGSTHYRV